MTFDQVKQEYQNESFDFAFATKKQVIKLSEWLDTIDAGNAAQMRWDDYQEELRVMSAEFD